MAKRSQINVALVGFTLFMTLVVLGIVIATLVKVYQKPASSTKDESDGLSGKPNIVNIPSDVSVSSQDGKKFAAYSAYVKTLQDSLNTSVNPCDDFFLYTCGNLQGPMSFYTIQYNNMLSVAKHARKDQSTKSHIAQQAAYHFKKCVDAHKDPKQIHQDGEAIDGIYRDFKDKTGLEFPVFQSSWAGNFPDANTFSKTLGILTGIYGVDTFISLQVDTNWEHPSDTGINSYEIYVDQTSLVFDDTYYTKAWEFIKEDYKNETLDILTKIAGYTKSTLDTSNLDSDIDDMLNLEYYIANNINTSPDVRRKYERQVNQQTIPDANKAHPNIDFKTYLQYAMTYASSDATDVVNAGGFKINLNEEGQLSNLIKYITNSTNVKPRTIYNYLFFRVLRANKNLLPEVKKSLTDKMIRNDNKQLGRKGRDRWRKLPREHFSELTDDEKIDITCAQENAEYLWYINARFFVEELLPTEQQRTELKSNVATLVASVLEGFQNQLDILDWMKDSTKQGAYSKIKYLVRNIAYPDQIFDEKWLAEFYNKLDIGFNDDYLKVVNSMKIFLTYKNFQVLALKDAGTVRDDFGGPPSIVNAWYQPEMNSITFPLGILQQPFYDINYPAAVNFGAMGVVAGHELTHGKRHLKSRFLKILLGFDDEGVQWDGFGRLYKYVVSFKLT
ncbi:Phosphate-regulating neutral endopeptidase [Aphelenchoides bicaudatus]|nr:Phosphate-regulating neutral endopeptidase [Aphelenchoides bicaudatus]